MELASRKKYVAKRLEEFVESSDYKIIVEQYIRKVVPKQSLLIEPEEGTEIYVCRLPELLLEDELFNLFSVVGPIFEIRLMVTPSGALNRTFGFIRFYKQIHADEAIRRFNDFKMPNNWNLRVTKSRNNSQLFLKGFDLVRNQFEIWDALRSNGVEGIKNVRVVSPHSGNPHHVNRGYAFVDFISHNAAATARKNFRADLMLFNRKIVVDWAIPLSEVLQRKVAQPDSTILLQNVDNISKLELIHILETAVPLEEVKNIYLKRKFCYIYFFKRQFGEIAFGKLKDFFKSSGQHQIEVLWANPQRVENSAGNSS